jgi:hypothetical protein
MYELEVQDAFPCTGIPSASTTLHQHRTARHGRSCRLVAGLKQFYPNAFSSVRHGRIFSRDHERDRSHLISIPMWSDFLSYSTVTDLCVSI